MSETVEDFLQNCSSCGQCSTVCPFLDTHGEPDDIIRNRPQLAFLCTNCTACDQRCPLDLSPADALFRTKQRLIAEGRLPESAVRALKGARSFAERGHKPPFTRYDAAATAFWPGCSLAGTSPETVKVLVPKLEELLGTEVGLVLDCCFDPLWQMGDTGPVREATGRIMARLAEAGINRLILGCMNCRKVFRDYLPDLDAQYILEVLPEDILAEGPPGDPYLHHPCPFYRLEGITDRTRAILQNGCEKEVDEPKVPICCGLGGSVNSQDEELAGRFTEKVTMDAYGATIVTSCMGCKNTFLKRGKETYHILELIAGVKPRTKAVSSVNKWAHRLALARVR